jgi:anthranilate synthase/indole-3-glycerol phosphate synthase/phosphoribosylanthranilate isomerase
MDTSAEYSAVELRSALTGLLADSSNPDHDGRHLFGYNGNSNDVDNHHELSTLQKITGTVILDYEKYQTQTGVPTAEELTTQAAGFAARHGERLNLQQVIQSASPRMALAAEFKRASPSKGDIACHLSAGEQARKYAAAGADIISVLSTIRWFKGSLDDLRQVRLETTQQAADAGRQRPAVLRKDFVTSEYMIAEAAAAGADTVLLIVAVLPEHLLKRLINYSRSLGMEPLVEVHADEELDVALSAGAKVIGVNNRNLHTFQMDLSRSEQVAAQLAEKGLRFRHGDDSDGPDYTLCALSGMSTAADVDRYRKAGLGMCLIGESLMRAADPAAAIAGLCLDPADYSATQQQSSTTSTIAGGAYTAGTQLIKVCGITNPEDALVACQAGASLIGVVFAEKSKRKVTSKQACDVVKAVRDFGERSDKRATFAIPEDSSLSPMAHLVASSRALVEGTRRPAVVGVFQNQDPDFVRQMVKECELDLIQLHGAEGMQAANLKNWGVPAIRVADIAVDPATGMASQDAVETVLRSLTNDPAAILLDTSIKGAKEGGGTGVSFDWTIAQRIQDSGLPVIIAGGLTPDSVGDCVTRIRPFGVDVAGGVELSFGKKDHDKVRDFVQRARSAAQEASKGF